MLISIFEKDLIILPTQMADHDLKSRLTAFALREGFDDIGVAAPGMLPRNKEFLKTFLELNWHGDMAWMQETSERRECPTNLWPDVKSVIMLAMNYGPDRDPLPELKKKSNGVISVYAKGKDYHAIIKQKLKNTASWLHRQTGEEVKVFVDTAPLMEKPLAMQAGIGWQGKHTNLVSQKFGSWVFLGAILTSKIIEPDNAGRDHCGTCDRCLTICPTDAFPAPYQLDATKCISYLTIEHKGIIPLELRRAIGNRIYGCDDCLAVCPWNKFAVAAAETRFHARPHIDNPPLDALLNLSEAEFKDQFKGTPIKRAGYPGFLRNCLIAAGNSSNNDLRKSVAAHLNASHSIVRASAIWAFGELADKQEISSAWQKIGQHETESDVKIEWHRINPQRIKPQRINTE